MNERASAALSLGRYLSTYFEHSIRQHMSRVISPIEDLSETYADVCSLVLGTLESVHRSFNIEPSRSVRPHTLVAEGLVH
jgi:hypothetical protein